MYIAFHMSDLIRQNIAPELGYEIWWLLQYRYGQYCVSNE